jgi:6-phosphogluconolactonase
MIMVTTYTDLERLAHTPKGSVGEGIYTFVLNLKDGSLRKRGVLPVSPNPAFLVKHPKLPVFYGTTECIDAPGEIFSLSLDPRCDAGIKLTGRTDAGGRSTCYINVCESERTLTVVNYWDAKVTTLPIDGVSGAVAGPIAYTYMQPGAEYVDNNKPDRMEHWQYRQRWPHTHCAVSDPYNSDGTRMFVCDLGRDTVMHFRLHGTTLEWTGEVKVKEGTGPRHAVFHPTCRACYTVNELTSSVSHYKFNDKDLSGQIEDCETEGAVLQHVRTISTLPEDWQDKQTMKNGVWKAASHCSEIRVHPAGTLLFVGNRYVCLCDLVRVYACLWIRDMYA